MGTLSLWPPAVSKGADRAVVRDLGARAVTTRDVGAAFGRAVAHMARGSRGKGGGELGRTPVEDRRGDSVSIPEARGTCAGWTLSSSRRRSVPKTPAFAPAATRGGRKGGALSRPRGWRAGGASLGLGAPRGPGMLHYTVRRASDPVPLDVHHHPARTSASAAPPRPRGRPLLPDMGSLFKKWTQKENVSNIAPMKASQQRALKGERVETATRGGPGPHPTGALRGRAGSTLAPGGSRGGRLPGSHHLHAARRRVRRIPVPLE